MSVTLSYTFGTATGSIPLTQLDSNFSTLANGINGMLDGTTQTFTNIITTGGTLGGTTTWSGATIAATRGGTGATTYTTGDILYASASNTLSKLSIGSAGQVLTVASGIPSWSSPTSGTITNNTTVISGGTSGAVLFNNANTVGEILPGTIGNVLLSNGTAWASSALQYTASGTGATARSYPAKMGDFVSVLDYGADPTGVADSTTAFQNAINSMGTLGGTVWVPPGLYTIDGTLTVGKATSPYISNVTLKGPTSQQEQPFNTAQYTTVACIRLNSAGTIQLLGGCGIDGLRIIRKGMTFSASSASSFAGTAVQTVAASPSSGSFVKNSMIVGFAQAIKMGGAGQYLVENTFIDCTAGVWIYDSFDVSRVVRTHCFPFATVSFSPTAAQNQRSGSAFKFDGQNDWTTMNDCFSYGYLGGINISGTAVMQILSCGVDNTDPYTGSYGIGVTSITGSTSINVTGSLFAGSENLTYIDGGANTVCKFTNCDFWGARNSATPTAGQGFTAVTGKTFLQNCFMYNNWQAYNVGGTAVVYGSGVALRNNTGAAPAGTITAMPTTVAV
jgi:hypothetical protein